MGADMLLFHLNNAVHSIGSCAAVVLVLWGNNDPRIDPLRAVAHDLFVLQLSRGLLMSKTDFYIALTDLFGFEVSDDLKAHLFNVYRNQFAAHTSKFQDKGRGSSSEIDYEEDLSRGLVGIGLDASNRITRVYAV